MVREGSSEVAYLPAEHTTFVGRLRELGELRELVKSERVVTVTGLGGSGKTRLAVRIASNMSSDFVDGAWFVDLTTSMGEVPGAIARALGVAEGAGAVMDALVDELRERHALLLLDNCEGLTGEVAGVVEPLLQACPDLVVLSTSREPLRLDGERVFGLSPLAVPPVDFAEPEEVMSYDAVELFADRAGHRRSGFEVTASNAAHVAEVCRKLDGLPLAIELAAARVSALGPQQIADRLAQRFQLLTTGRDAAPPRHQTLRACVEWSHDLLPDLAKVLMRRLAVFRGSFLPRAAEVVCADGALDRSAVLDTYERLVDHSLILIEDVDGAARGRFLETIREFAAEELERSGEEETLARRLVAWAVEVVERWGEALIGPGAADAMAKIDAEHDNLRGALDWSVRLDLGELGHRLVASMWRFWRIRGYLDEGRAWCERVIELDGWTPRSRARALHGAATLAIGQGAFETSVSFSEEALVRARELDDARLEATTLNILGNAAQHLGDFPRAREHYDQSAQIARDLGDVHSASVALINLGGVALGTGDAELARVHWEEALDGLRTVGFEEGTAHTLNNLANLDFNAGQLGTAEERWTEALEVFRSLSNEPGVASVLCNLGMLATMNGQPSQARRHLRESLKLHQQEGDPRGIAAGLRYYAGALARLGDGMRAAYVLGTSEALRERIGAPPFVTEPSGGDPEADEVRPLLDEETFASRTHAGRTASVDRVIAEILADVQPTTGPAEPEAVFRLEGDSWTVRFGGGPELRLSDRKGMHHLAELLRRPRREVHVLDLVAALEGTAPGAEHVDPDTLSAPGAGDDVLDAEARTAYRARLEELAEEIEAAESLGDGGRASRARAETDALTEQLATGMGLGGRARRAATAAERARVNVTKQIRSAIARIGQADPPLGEHLSSAVRTGVFCEYRPDPGAEVAWRL